jgi:Alkylmercury lyase
VDSFDLGVRNFLYRSFSDRAETPHVEDIEAEFGLDRDEAEFALRRLHDAHALVLEQDTVEIRMLNPFSCVPTEWRVSATGRTWYANCAWDAFGVCAALHADGRIDTSCADCGELVEIEIRDGRAVPDDHLFHVLVPAGHWWDDIVFT